ncbi:MAG: hypothetical protein R2742_03840 [Micropruina glycogenica]
MAEGDVLFVDVAADRRVWEGEALSVIVRTMEGDIGISAQSRAGAGGAGAQCGRGAHRRRQA